MTILRAAHPALALDRAEPFSRAAIRRARRAEVQYGAQLRKVARAIGDLVEGVFDPEDPATIQTIDDALTRYAALIEPWANAVGRRMLAEVAARDRRMWKDLSNKMGQALHLEIDTTPTGALMQQRLADQVGFIKSLPLEAAQRVQKLTVEALTDSRRADEIAKEIMRSGEVAKSRADLIARTEVGRTATELNRARAEHIGSTHFIWRTAGDADVRKRHRHLNGKAFAWDDPPVAGEKGERYLPGAGPNCRCFAEPVLPERDRSK